MLLKFVIHSEDEIAAPDSFLSFISTKSWSLLRAFLAFVDRFLLYANFLNSSANSDPQSSPLYESCALSFNHFWKSVVLMSSSSDPSFFSSAITLYIVCAVASTFLAHSVDAFVISSQYKSFIAVVDAVVFTAPSSSFWNHVGLLGSQNHTQ